MTMDYQASLQQYVMQIGTELADLQTLNPSQIVTKLQTITNSGMQEYIIQTIRTCIQHYQKDRAIIKYAYVMDKLLKLPVWNQLMQNVIVQFFCDIFVFLLNQKCFNQIDELKILRKFWLKTIHPRHLQAMKDIILAQTSIDIDQYFKREVIATIKTHYEKKLRLTSEQMNFHLPKTLKTTNIVYESKTLKTQQLGFIDNANYLISTQPIVPAMMNPNIMSSNIIPNTIRRSVSPQPLIQNLNQVYHNPNAYNLIQTNQYYQQPMIVNDPSRINPAMIQRVSPPLDPRDPRTGGQRRYPLVTQKMIITQQNVTFYPEKAEFINENLKRERFYSEETRTPNSSQYMNNQASIQIQHQMYQKMQYQVESQPQHQIYQKMQYEVESQPQKRINYSDAFQFLRQQPQLQEKEGQRPKYSKILQMLRGDKLFKCKQCGKGHKSMKEYEKHFTEHFQEKLQQREKKKQSTFLLSLDEWTNNRSGSSLQQFNQFYISIRNLTSSPQNLKIQPLQFTCKLCNQPFDVKFLQDQWVLNNATYCEIDGLELPMHKTCQEALEDSSNEYF